VLPGEYANAAIWFDLTTSLLPSSCFYILPVGKTPLYRKRLANPSG